jgi:hypothetical protein
MDKQDFKNRIEEELEAETRKLFPDLTRKEIFVAAIVASGLGWVLMNIDSLGSGLRLYGGLMFAAGIVVSILTFDPDR